MRITYLFIFLVSAGFLSIAESTNTGHQREQTVDMANNPVNNIRPYFQNHRYWQYNNEPTLLIGGSIQDNLFQVDHVEKQLNTLSESGGNYVRNTMSSRDEGDVWEFKKLENGKYDLDQLNEEYFNRFKNLLELARQRNIIVQIELWDRFDFAREPWQSNPFRPANNINYTDKEIGLKNEYPEHPGSNNNPFFRSVPAQNNNQKLLKYQQKRVNRILEICFQYPNVLYVMDNETSANPDWGAFWARYIQKRAEDAGVKVQTTEMWDAWNLRDEEHKRTLDQPELYDFADISQNNHNSNQEHWDNLQWARNYVSGDLRPLNNVKIYGADEGEYGTQRDAVERFWRNIIGGSASARFHRPSSGIGLSRTAQANLKSARQFVDRHDLFGAIPDSKSELLSDRSPDEAYLSYIPGQAYAIYFTDGGAINLDLGEQSGTFSVSWLDIDKTAWRDGKPVSGGHLVSLSTPGQGQWIVLLKKE